MFVIKRWYLLQAPSILQAHKTFQKGRSQLDVVLQELNLGSIVIRRLLQDFDKTIKQSDDFEP